jgi:serine/threonine protein kinase/tetratricopeptide (TPR) repeat protein
MPGRPTGYQDTRGTSINSHASIPDATWGWWRPGAGVGNPTAGSAAPALAPGGSPGRPALLLDSMTDPLALLQAALADRYRVERELGQGGTAVVYLAEDLKHHRHIALKVLRSSLAASLEAERFLLEIEIAAALTHPHILPLYDSGEAGGLVYYVMPYVEGPSLRQRLEAERQLPVPEALKIARQVVGALDYAHRRGLVHRDIKPENIMLYEGEALVADFGIALALRSGHGARVTEEGIVIGTPIYMSPEQAVGDPVDARSDLYSMGCVLYEMLAGAPPYVGDSTMAITAQKLVDPVPPLARRREEVSPEVETALVRALACKAEERFATAAEFAAALERPGGAVPGRAARPGAGPAAAPSSSIAVLPFVNMSTEPDSEFFSDGIAEELTNALSKLEGLHVVARGSAFAFRGEQEDVREIGRRLGVSTVLEGSVRRSGNQVRVTAELVSAADGYRLWSERFDRRLDDVFAIQDEIAAAIAEVLQATLLGAPRAYAQEPVKTGDPRAYEHYLRGRHLWNERTTSALELSVEEFQRALAIDPRHAPSYAGIADSYVILGVYSHRPQDEVMPKAKAAAEQALAIDASLAEAHTALACVRALYEWDWPAADALFRRAIAHNPQYATAHQWYAMNCLVPQGLFDEARAELGRALALDPLSLAVNTSVGLCDFYARQRASATAALQQTVELNQQFGAARYFLGHALIATGRYDEAIGALERAVTLQEGSAETTAALATAHALAHHHPEAEALLADLERRSREVYVSPALLAQVHLGLADHAAALERLEEAAARRTADVVWLKVHPIYDPVRGHPRFRALLERTRLA